MNIQGLNQVTQPNAYSLLLQSDVISLIRDCKYIMSIDDAFFFY